MIVIQLAVIELTARVLGMDGKNLKLDEVKFRRKMICKNKINVCLQIKKIFNQNFQTEK